MVIAGCQSPGSQGVGSSATKRKAAKPSVRGVVCLFDHRPWLNADAAGDRDPEGIRFRVFLDSESVKGVLREGTFHVELYQIGRRADGEMERTLVSDWHYPTSRFSVVSAKILGMGYHLQLRWARKDIAGHEIELITQFEDRGGNITRSGTKRLRVPKYVS